MRDALPVVIIGGMVQPIEIPGSELAQQGLIDEGQMRHQRRGITHRLHDGSHLFPTCLSLAHASLHFFGNHRERPEKDPKLEHPSLVTHRGLVIVRGSYLGSDGPQSLGMLLGQQPLSKPKIGVLLFFFWYNYAEISPHKKIIAENSPFVKGKSHEK